jgi:hypothetical protein
MNEPERPNANYDHVYAIIRLDKEVAAYDLSNKNWVVVKKVVRSKEVAEQEVNRLNRLNSDKGCEYFYQITRLEREPHETTAAVQERAAVPGEN